MHEILKYKLNNLHVLTYLHVFFKIILHVSYSSILIGAVGLSQYYVSPVQCRDSVNSGGGGGEFGQFSKFKSGGGGGLRNFQDPGGDGFCRTMTFSRGIQTPMTLCNIFKYE